MNAPLPYTRLVICCELAYSYISASFTGQPSCLLSLNNSWMHQYTIIIFKSKLASCVIFQPSHYSFETQPPTECPQPDSLLRSQSNIRIISCLMSSKSLFTERESKTLASRVIVRAQRCVQDVDVVVPEINLPTVICDVATIAVTKTNLAKQIRKRE